MALGEGSTLPVQTRSFLLVCAPAGGLAVPVHAVASPVSATVALLLGLVGLRVWRWSGLPDSIRAEAPGGFARFVRPADGAANPGIAWGATLLSAMAFAAVHLPAWSAAGTLTVGLVLVVLALNGLGGLVFGYLFIKRGIAAAMWAHAGADCAIQLIGPLTR